MVHLSFLQFGIQPRNAHCTGRVFEPEPLKPSELTLACLDRDLHFYVKSYLLILVFNLFVEEIFDFMFHTFLQLMFNIPGDGRALQINTTVTPLSRQCLHCRPLKHSSSSLRC